MQSGSEELHERVHGVLNPLQQAATNSASSAHEPSIGIETYQHISQNDATEPETASPTTAQGEDKPLDNVQ